MVNIEPKELARVAEDLLAIAIVKVLEEGKNECLGLAAISKRAGIFQKPASQRTKGNNDQIAWGMMRKLEEHGVVVRCKQNDRKGSGGWKLKTPGGFDGIIQRSDLQNNGD